MASLYEIDKAILECVDGESGEILDADRLDALMIERDGKIENVALWYKNLISDAEAYKAEKEAFAAKEKAARNKAESLKGWLSAALAGQAFKTTRVTASYRKSTPVVIDDVDRIPEEYLRTVTEVSPDNVAIKEAIAGGKEIPGAHVEEKMNLSIK